MEVGKVEYIVEANTAQLIKAERDVVKSADNIEGSLKKVGKSSKEVDKVTESVDKLGKEANDATPKLSRLHQALLAVVSVSALSEIGKMADDYRTMGERVGYATQSTEEFEIVQARLLKTANEAYRPLAELQEGFIGLSANIREYGYDLNETMDITDSMTFAFVKNATSAMRAESAMRAYDSALNKGTANSMAWYSINQAIPTLAEDMAKQLNVTLSEILRMGNAGEITAQMLNDTLLSSFESNRKAGMEMATSIADAMVKLKNNLSTYVGEANKSLGATDLVASAIDSFADSIDVLAKGLLAIGAGAMAKYIASVGMQTVASMKATLATRAQTAEALANAKANEAQALSALQSAQRNLALGGSHAKVTTATKAHTLAVAELSRAQSAHIGIASRFMSLLGGPAGIAGLLIAGASAFFMFRDSSNEAKESLNQLEPSLDSILEKFEKLNNVQRASKLIEFQEELRQKTRATSDAYQELDNAVTKYLRKDNLFGSIGRRTAEQTDQVWGLTRALKETIQTGGDVLLVVNDFADKLGVDQETRDSWIVYASAILTASNNASDAKSKIEALITANNNLNSSLKQTAEDARAVKNATEAGLSSVEEMQKDLKRQTDALSDNGSEYKRITRLIEEKRKAGEIINETDAQNLKQTAKQIDLDRESAKLMKSSTGTANDNAQAIANLRNELYLATLSGKELAIARAEQSLNKFASQQEIESVRQLASALYELNEIKKFGDTAEKQDAYFTNADPLSGGEFDNQAERYQAEYEKEQERYNNLLLQFQTFREAKIRTEEEYNQIEADMKAQHEARLTQIAKAENSVRLKAYSSAFGSIADVLKEAQGEQSSAYKAMFAVSKAFAVADATMNAYNAISKAWASAPFPANLAAVAATAPAVMGVVSSIQGTNYGGGRQYGGGVSADKMYRINETGQPEIFNAGGGKQYFLPNQRGEVIPANKSPFQQGSQGSNVTVNLIESESRAGEVNQSSTEESTVIDIFVANIYSGGKASQAIEDTYGVRRIGK